MSTGSTGPRSVRSAGTTCSLVLGLKGRPRRRTLDVGTRPPARPAPSPRLQVVHRRRPFKASLPVVGRWACRHGHRPGPTTTAARPLPAPSDDPNRGGASDQSICEGHGMHGQEDTATSGQEGPSPCTGPTSLGHPGYDVRLTFASLKVALNTSGAGPSSRRTARGASGHHDEGFHDDDHVLRPRPSCSTTRPVPIASWIRPTDCWTPSSTTAPASTSSTATWPASGMSSLTSASSPASRRDAAARAVSMPRSTSSSSDANRACVQARLSIVFAGHPGARKTTLMSCTTAELDPALRVVVAEEVFEADIPLPSVAHMQTRAARSDREPVDLRRLVAGFLRMAPDVAIVGEVREREALPELLSHDGRLAGWQRAAAEGSDLPSNGSLRMRLVAPAKRRWGRPAPDRRSRPRSSGAEGRSVSLFCAAG
jgi:hypothetical protein